MLASGTACLSASIAASKAENPIVHPNTIEGFEKVYREEYEQNLASCDRWIKWCKDQNDYYGVSFHQGLRSAYVLNDIKMCQLIRILKQEPPNAK